MDWTAGYASDIEYTAGFYREQGPAFLNFASVLNGVEPVDTDAQFNYFELGFGRGVTVNMLAATNPHAQFYAADFNPAHVADARQMAASAGLDNIHLFENSFEELAKGAVPGLPMFDFITLHGIYTWVTSENRAHIVHFLNRYLKPGGIVYVSYNAMPGWTASLPLQRLLVEYADLHPDRSDIQIKGAAEFVSKLRETHAGYFENNTALTSRLETLASGNVNYLVHEYMHKHWQPLYHADVARDLADAKLEFVGMADLPSAYMALSLTPEQIEVIKGVPDATLRETVKDYYHNTMFRKDVFVRGARKLNAGRRSDLLKRFGLALVIPRDDVKLVMAVGGRQFTGQPEHYNPVLDAVANKPMTMGELMALPALREQTQANLTQIFALLVASGQAMVYEAAPDPEARDAGAKRMNQVLALASTTTDEFQVLASGLLGSALGAHFVERIVYHLLVTRSVPVEADSLAQAAWAIMKSRDRRMTKEGKPLVSDEENVTELTEQIGKVLKTRILLWKQLRLI